MKKTSLLLVLFIIFSCQKNDFDGFLLKGNIKGLKNSISFSFKVCWRQHWKLIQFWFQINQFEYSGKG